MMGAGTVGDIRQTIAHAKALLKAVDDDHYNMPNRAYTTISDLLLVIEELFILDIVSRNPGIDPDEVRAHRAATQSGRSDG